ncbi:IS200/IS605 family transposase [Rosistilla oblonga]|uniref:IS200/IS605 family transposase n=1 Tax=Rosistilla oblonga TaxID=2527990 RepID=UPI003A969063
MSTHQQLLYHIVFSVKDRRPLLQDDALLAQVWSYMAGIAKNLEGFAIKIGGFYDHAHVLVRIPAKIAVADFVGALKSNSSRQVNDARAGKLKFHWQDGYGAFTVSPSQADRVVRYIQNQLTHHAKQTFQDEYLALLAKHEIEFDPARVWE